MVSNCMEGLDPRDRTRRNEFDSQDWQFGSSKL